MLPVDCDLPCNRDHVEDIDEVSKDKKKKSEFVHERIMMRSGL
jgi:hypothetical protein